MSKLDDTLTSLTSGDRPPAKQGDGSYMAFCPAHDDGTKTNPGRPSLHVTEADNGDILLRCFAGCSTDQILTEADLGYDALYAEPLKQQSAAPPEKVSERKWPIHDTDGTFVAHHVRYEFSDGSKEFRWRNPRGGYRLDRPVAEVPLYGAEDIPDFSTNRMVILVEGEKARDALKATGAQCVASVTGSGTAPLETVLEALRGHSVVLWGDSDVPGRKHMEAIARKLAPIARSLRHYTWEEAPEKGDAADHPGTQGDEMAFKRMTKELSRAPQYRPGAIHAEAGVESAGEDQPRRAKAVHISGYSEELARMRQKRADSEDGITGLRSKLHKLDAAFAGFNDGCSYVFGGNTGDGKSLILSQIAATVAMDGLTSLVNSTEMPGKLYLDRLEHYVSGVPFSGARYGLYDADSFRKLREAHEYLASLDLYFDQSSPQTVDAVRANIEEVQPDLVVIDHLQNMRATSLLGNRSQDLGSIVREIIGLKGEYDIPILIASQLSRAAVQRNNKTPQLSDLRDSGEIEEGQDGVILLYRPEELGFEGYEKNDVSLKIAKNRDGETTTVECSRIYNQLWLEESGSLPDPTPLRKDGHREF